MQSFLSHQIRRSIEVFDYQNASFLAERLHTEFPTHENLVQVAVVFHRWGKPQRAYQVLRSLITTLQRPGYSGDGMSPSFRANCRYLFGDICYQLQKYEEAEQVLSMRENGVRNVPNGAAGYHLLGRVARARQQRDEAIRHFRKALELNSFLWSAYEQLCQLGEIAEPNGYFRLPSPASSKSSSPSANEMMQTGAEQYQQSLLQCSDNSPQTFRPSPTASFRQPGGNGMAMPAPPPPAGAQQSFPSYSNENGGSFTLVNAADVTHQPHQPHQLSFSTAALGTPAYAQQRVYSPSMQNSATPLPGLAPKRRRGEPQSENQRPNKRKSPTTYAQDAPSKRSKTSAQDTDKCSQLFRRLARGYMHLCRYGCKEALLEFRALPPIHQRSGWVLAQIGRAHFECADYAKAVKAYKEMRRNCPWRTEGIEIYSTALWHLKADMALSHLAQHAKEQDAQAPETWIAIGNCFSRQNDPERAIQFFQKAISLDPNLAYAYTLCAHEYLANEDYDAAEKHYRHAMRLDPRHYNAWYGLGNIHMHREKYDLAIYHFSKAISINKRSSVLHVCMGMTFQKHKKPKEALRALDLALRFKPNNPLACFQKARIHMSLGEYEEACAALKKTTELAPTESMAHFTLGKVYKKLNKTTDALQSFSLALNLNPKDKNSINQAINQLRPERASNAFALPARDPPGQPQASPLASAAARLAPVPGRRQNSAGSVGSFHLGTASVASSVADASSFRIHEDSFMVDQPDGSSSLTIPYLESASAQGSVASRGAGPSASPPMVPIALWAPDTLTL